MFPSGRPDVLAGDWAGAWLAAGAGLAVMGAMSVAATLLDGGQRFDSATSGVHQVVADMALAVGGSYTAQDGLAASAVERPTGLTVAGLATIAMIFVRRLRATAGDTPVTRATAAWQVFRTAVIFAALLVAVLVASLVAPSREAEVGIVSTMFLGTTLLVAVLCVTAWMAVPGLVPGAAETVRRRLAGPARATGVLAVAATVLAVAGLAVWTALVGVDAAVWRGEAAVALRSFPELAVAGVLFGMGVPVSATAAAAVGAYGAGTSVSILDAILVDPRYGLWPLLVAALLVVTGYLAARWSPPAEAARYQVGWLGVILPAVLLTGATAAGGDGWGAGLGALSFAGPARFDYLIVLLVAAVSGVALGMLGAMMLPAARGAAPDDAAGRPPASAVPGPQPATVGADGPGEEDGAGLA